MGCCFTSSKIGVTDRPLPILVKNEPQINYIFHWGYEDECGKFKSFNRNNFKS